MNATRANPIDLFCGAAYGLGLSAMVWGSILAPPAMNPGGIVMLLLAAVAGVTGCRLRRLGPLPLVLGVTLAALSLYGLGHGVLAASVAALTATGSRRPRHVARQVGCRVGVAATLSFAAGLIYLGLGGPVGAPSWPVNPWPPIGFALTFAILERVIRRTALAVAPGGRPRIGPATSGLRFVAQLLLGPAVAAGTLIVLASTGPLVWIPVGVSLALGYLLGRAARRQATAPSTPALSPSMQRCLVRAIGRSSSGGDPIRERRHERVRATCEELGRRLALTEDELEALEGAANVHELGRIAVQADGDAVAVHPGLTDELLGAMALPGSIREIVAHRREWFDGHGRPDGLAGDDIPLGSRILATVSAFEDLRTKHPTRRRIAPGEARGLLCRDSGRIHDPMVIDTLLEVLDERDAEMQVATATTAHRPGATSTLCLPDTQRHLQALNEIARVVGCGGEIGDLPGLLGPHLTRLIPHRSMVIHLLDPKGERLEATHGYGPESDQLQGTHMMLGEPVSGWVAGQRRVASDEDHEVGCGVSPDGLPCASMLAAPLVAADRCWGTLTIYDAPDRQYTAAERRNLLTAAGYLAHRTALCQQQPAGPAVDLTDPATGLPNARYLWLELGEMIATASLRRDFALLAFRIGSLEELSRHEGIEATERALCRAARRLAVECRPDETLVRFGPDLFLVLSPQSDADHQRLLGRWDRLRRRLSRDAAEIPHSPLRIHAGCVRFPVDGTSPEQLFERLQARLDLSVDEGKMVLPFAAASRTVAS